MSNKHPIILLYEYYKHTHDYPNMTIFYNCTARVISMFRTFRFITACVIDANNIIVLKYDEQILRTPNDFYKYILSAMVSENTLDVLNSFSCKYSTQWNGVWYYNILYNSNMINITIFNDDLIKGLGVNGMDIVINGHCKVPPNYLLDLNLDLIDNQNIYDLARYLINNEYDNEVTGINDILNGISI